MSNKQTQKKQDLFFLEPGARGHEEFQEAFKAAMEARVRVCVVGRVCFYCCSVLAP